MYVLHFAFNKPFYGDWLRNYISSTHIFYGSNFGTHFINFMSFEEVLHNLEIGDELVFVSCVHFYPRHWYIAYAISPFHTRRSRIRLSLAERRMGIFSPSVHRRVRFPFKGVKVHEGAPDNEFQSIGPRSRTTCDYQTQSREVLEVKSKCYYISIYSHRRGRELVYRQTPDAP